MIIVNSYRVKRRWMSDMASSTSSPEADDRSKFDAHSAVPWKMNLPFSKTLVLIKLRIWTAPFCPPPGRWGKAIQRDILL